MKTRFAALATVAAAFLAASALAQNPRGAAVTTLGDKKIAVDYGRPALKGRTIDALLKQLPPERIWRAGENEVSTFSTEADIKIAGKAVKAGKYSLYIHVPRRASGPSSSTPTSASRWDDLGRGAREPEERAVAPTSRATSRRSRRQGGPARGPRGVDRRRARRPLTISFAPKGTGADLTLAWGKEAWSIEVQPAK